MVGKKFNRLTVIGEDTEKYKLTGRYYSICKCDCGNIVSSPSTLIRAGISKSCGCYRKEKFEQDKKKADRKKSFFEINGDIAYLHLTNSDKVAIIDVDDIEKGNLWNLLCCSILLLAKKKGLSLTISIKISWITGSVI